MWLLKTDLTEDGSFLPILYESEGHDIPPYAILSHTWEEEEVLFSDVFPNPRNAHLKLRGFSKVQKAAERARLDGYRYIWIDTCCIKKESSAELQEAINSMYAWYQQAEKCYAYLFDFPSFLKLPKGLNFGEDLSQCKWFTRGWTLQELLAPHDVIFYSSAWQEIGTKTSLAKVITSITSIDIDYLTEYKSIQLASVAERMSWAAFRQTRRIEDIAYSLMGIFDVNMPMLYGEGAKAFLRLQEEVWKRHEDQSLFAWLDPEMDNTTQHGLLADSPTVFAKTASISAFGHEEGNSLGSISSKGVRIELPITENKDLHQARLNCPAPNFNSDKRALISINLKKVDWGSKQYVRVSCNSLGRLPPHDGSLQTIFVPQQTHHIKRIEHILYPETSVHFCKNPNASSQGQYVLVDVFHDANALRPYPASYQTSHGKCGSSAWNFHPFPRYLTILDWSKLLFVFLFRRRLDGNPVAVLWGTDRQSRLVFSAFPTSLRQFQKTPGAIDEFRSRLLNESARPMDEVIRLLDHKVGVFCKTNFAQTEKSLTLDLSLEPRWSRAEELARDRITTQDIATMPAKDTVYDLSSKLRKLKGLPDGVNAVAFSPDGKRIVSGSVAGSVRIWSATNGELIKALVHGTAEIQAVAFQSDGFAVTFVCDSGPILSWRWNQDSAVMEGAVVIKGAVMKGAVMKGYAGGSRFHINAAAISKDQTKIVFVSDASVWLWNSLTGAVRQIGSFWDQTSANGFRGFDVAISPDGSFFAVFQSEKLQAAILDSVTGAIYIKLGKSLGSSAVAFSPTGKKFATLLEAGQVRLWDHATTKQENLLHHGMTGDTSSLAFSPDGSRLAVASGGVLRLWDLAEGIQLGCQLCDSLTGIAFSPDGKQFAGGSLNGTIWHWNLSETPSHKSEKRRWFRS